ncbi:DNA-3-methyladenine glycosylase I [Thermopetrobacter sp. TC1]|uniref:DNA-3-methyladenine glycosylase I n=1 Tax=Thermopetrobacter sp. TC1 TaxID=1495045 RepID=UPI00056DBF47|nr:DNA-3-methyladenine glycosylase I [Thermopetrobacter sp. TC1]
MGIAWEEDVIVHADGRARCGWCGRDPLYVRYHDEEWGVPERDGQKLFEKLVLDTFQAGLSWLTILRKRTAFRRAFAGFDPEVIAAWGDAEVNRLMQNAGIVRNRAKIEAAITNARAVCAMGGPVAFSRFLWEFVDGTPVINAPRTRAEVPAQSPLSRKVAGALKARGFAFCGPVVVQAFLQAAGLINDHLISCHRHPWHDQNGKT